MSRRRATSRVWIIGLVVCSSGSGGIACIQASRERDGLQDSGSGPDDPRDVGRDQADEIELGVPDSDPQPEAGNNYNLDDISAPEVLLGRECARYFVRNAGVDACSSTAAACSAGFAVSLDGCFRSGCEGTSCCDLGNLVAHYGADSCAGEDYPLGSGESACVETAHRVGEGLFRGSGKPPCFEPAVCPESFTWRDAAEFAPVRRSVVAVSPLSQGIIVFGDGLRVWVSKDNGSTFEMLKRVLPTGPDSGREIASWGRLLTVAFDASGGGFAFATSPLSGSEYQTSGYVRFDDLASLQPIAQGIPKFGRWSQPVMVADPRDPETLYIAGTLDPDPLDDGVAVLGRSVDRGATWEALVEGSSLNESDRWIRDLVLADLEDSGAKLIGSTLHRVLLIDAASGVVEEIDATPTDSPVGLATQCDAGGCRIAVAFDGGSVKTGALTSGSRPDWRSFTSEVFHTKFIVWLADGTLATAGIRVDALHGLDEGHLRQLDPISGSWSPISNGLPGIAIRPVEAGDCGDPMLFSVPYGIDVSRFTGDLYLNMLLTY